MYRSYQGANANGKTKAQGYMCICVCFKLYFKFKNLKIEEKIPIMKKGNAQQK